ncbi:hypothetical protein [Rheinheimera sp.]|uniref:hypothetical protein n=1 Tax=Rheinheimera sp. TaxID=1869214 RepID=UPI00307D13C7
MIQRVEITLCVGLVGVCIIGLLGDEWDAVYGHISDVTPEDWLESLPEHDKPMEGIYTLVCDVDHPEDDDQPLKYSVVEVKAC